VLISLIRSADAWEFSLAFGEAIAGLLEGPGATASRDLVFSKRRTHLARQAEFRLARIIKQNAPSLALSVV
jgi:hypothetical protein